MYTRFTIIYYLEYTRNIMNIDELKNMSEKELIEHLKKIYERYSIEFDDFQDNLNKVLRELQNQNNNVINDFRNSNYL